MTNLHIRKAMRYQLDYMFKASIWFVGIILVLAIIASLFISNAVYIQFGFIDIDSFTIDANTSFVFFDVGAAMVLTLFIVGIVGIREDFKFYIQHGMGRRTTFFSTLFISLIMGAAAGLFSELLTLAYNQWAFFPASGLRFAFTESNFFINWLISALSIFYAWQFGSMLSLIYFRLNKTAKIIFTVAVIAVLAFVIPNTIGFIISIVFPFASDSETVFLGVYGLLSSPANMIMIILTMGVICAVANYFLIRGAQARD